jgi:hypothetical protein
MRTQPIKDLVAEVVASLPRPYEEDVIEDAFLAIEGNSEWRERYDDLVDEFTESVTNQWGGYWVKDAVGGISVTQVDSYKSSLIGSYTKLRW